MRVWCGDFETDEWVVGCQIDYLLIAILILLVAFAYYKIKMNNTMNDLRTKLKKCEDDCKKKLTDAEEDCKKKIAACEGQKPGIVKGAKKEVLVVLDAKLREIQDTHRSTMISDNYNRIMWIAEGVRQARDAVENSINSI